MLVKIGKLISSVFDFLFVKSNIFKRKRNKPFRFLEVEGEYPSRLKFNTLYILTEDGKPWEAKFICPSGCGAELTLNLLADEHPRWEYSISKNGEPTLYPSVNREIGCRAHFWLKEGNIFWV